MHVLNKSCKETSETKKKNITIEFYILYYFRYNFFYNSISLVTEFQVKLTILNFFDQISQKKGISDLNKNKIKITIEFYMFQLV